MDKKIPNFIKIPGIPKKTRFQSLIESKSLTSGDVEELMHEARVSHEKFLSLDPETVGKQTYLNGKKEVFYKYKAIASKIKKVEGSSGPCNNVFSANFKDKITAQEFLDSAPEPGRIFSSRPKLKDWELPELGDASAVKVRDEWRHPNLLKNHYPENYYEEIKSKEQSADASSALREVAKPVEEREGASIPLERGGRSQ